MTLTKAYYSYNSELDAAPPFPACLEALRLRFGDISEDEFQERVGLLTASGQKRTKKTWLGLYRKYNSSCYWDNRPVSQKAVAVQIASLVR